MPGIVKKSVVWSPARLSPAVWSAKNPTCWPFSMPAPPPSPQPIRMSGSCRNLLAVKQFPEELQFFRRFIAALKNNRSLSEGIGIPGSPARSIRRRNSGGTPPRRQRCAPSARPSRRWLSAQRDSGCIPARWHPRPFPDILPEGLREISELPAYPPAPLHILHQSRTRQRIDCGLMLVFCQQAMKFFPSRMVMVSP